ncbi:MAG: DUF1552 domain-containing protein [Myxococcales bacterium]|nr:DUF1552 domain-containing protein [Myxococcales bacterium]
MTKKSFTRRSLLKGLGLGAAGLPFVPLLREGTARAATFPKRLVIVFTANGTIPSAWTPTGSPGSGSAWALNTILKPLSPFKSKLNVLEGVDQESAYHGPGDGHQKGMGHLLTGTELLAGSQFQGGDGGTVGWGGGISIDQHIANKVGASTKFKSLEFGVQVKSADIWSRMSYTGSNKPVPPEEDPYQAFDRLFGTFSKDVNEIQRLRTQRKSVLDAVKSEFTALQAKLGTVDRQKLESHLAGVRAVEKLLDGSTSLPAACQVPTLGNKIDIKSNSNYLTVGKLFMDLTAMSLACNLTQVITLQWSRAVSNISTQAWTGVSEGHHSLSHEGDSNGDAENKLIKINTWYAEQFAYLLNKLDSIPEGNGTVLDNTVVVWGNELGKGNSHTRRDIPFVLAGSCGGYFQTDRFLKYDKDPHNNLLVSLANAMGDPISTFGNPNYCTGPLAQLK